jgi:5-methylthioadenosine/S-adenosylhomocysteine deaminase
MAGPPIEGGEVVVADDGHIAEVGAAPGPSGPHALGPAVALVPGLVNAHTHLELTGFAGQVDDAEFSAWIPHIIRLKAARSRADFLAAARQGIRDCWAMGVTTVADCGDSGAVIEALAELDGSGIAYHEIFGPHPDDADRQLEAWTARMRELRRFERPRVRLGASPHAPYTVSGPLYRMAAAWARAEGLPIAVHVAEAADESALLADGSGGFADWLRGRDIPLPGPGYSPVQWLERHAVFGPDTLAIHTVRVGAADIAILAGRGCGVAHCPRSNRRHGHGDAPLARLLGAVPRLGVGTDSVASVAPLDLLAEARAARALAALDAEAAFRLVTTGAAAAIGLAVEIGSLTPGKWGDVTAVRIPEGTGADGLFEALLAAGPADVLGTWLAGRQVFASGS